MKYSSRGQGNLFDGGKIIKDKLEERYVTQSELAESIGMSNSKLSDIINGHRRPSKVELQNIATELDISIAEWKKQSKYVSMAFPTLGAKFY